MCGIAGIWHLNEVELSEAKLKAFTDSMYHRGPDGAGYTIFKESNCGLGHRRLSILDLSPAGKQPMTFEDSGLHITYNGEIYNFLEIRTELKALGFNFRTETDTEVILAAYLKWGFAAFDKFNGMWAIAIYNARTKKLLLCRDRFGVKPLYYSFLASVYFAFASETHAFRYLEGFNLHPEINMMGHAIDNPVKIEGTGKTIWENIYQVLAGHYFEIDFETKQISQKRWFKIPQTQSNLSYEKASEMFYDLFYKSVSLRLRSDVPVGCALSGGLDSSAVYSLMNFMGKNGILSERVNYQLIKGFVATFDGTPQEETEYARAVVQHCNGQVKYIGTDFTSLVSDLETSTRLFNDISGSPILALSQVYREMRKEGYYVSLDGHGVDEMLYGYKSLVGMAIMEAVENGNETQEADLLRTYVEMFDFNSQLVEARNIGRRIAEYKAILGLDRSLGKAKHFLKRKIKSFNKKKTTYSYSNDEVNPYRFSPAQVLTPLLGDAPVNLEYYSTGERELAIDFYYRNIPYNMRDFDRAAMQSGVEIRMPFMDFNLVNFVFSLPTNYKVGGGYTKRIMRDSLKGILPEKVRTRKSKIGMGAPIASWFNNELRIYIIDTVKSQKFLSSDLWNGKEVAELVVRHSKNRSWTEIEAQRFWNILNAYLILP